MTKNFTKTLIAASLLSVMGVASAATIPEFTPVGLSKQASNALTINGNQFNIDNGVQYEIGTEIVVNFSAGELSVAPVAEVFRVTTSQAAGSVAGAPVAYAGPVFERVSQTATSATFRLKDAVVPANVARVQESAPAAGDGADGVQYLVRISGYQFTLASALAQDSISATVLAKANTGVAIDPAGQNQTLTRPVLFVGDQFTSKVDSVVEKEVNLASLRTKFNGPVGTEDRQFAMTIKTSNLAGVPYKRDSDGLTPTGVATFAATATAGASAYRYVVTGDFSWLVDTNSAAGIQPATGTISYSANCATQSLTATALEFRCTGAAPGNELTNTVTFDVFQGQAKAPVALPDTTFNVTATVATTSPTGSFVTLTNERVAAFKNDGTSVAVDYLPYGAGISQILYVTNKTSQVGKIYVTAFDETGTKLLDSFDVGTTTANGLTQIAGEVRSALGDSYNGRVALKIDIESSDATVFSAYNVSGDRLFTPAVKK